MNNPKKKKPNQRTKKEKLNTKYLKLYKSFGKVYCPALKTDVHFTGKGWVHIQKEKWRTRSKKEERLKLLPLAKKILGITTTIQEIRNQIYHGSKHKQYGFTACWGGERITVVVIEDAGRLDFLSVFKGKMPPAT